MRSTDLQAFLGLRQLDKADGYIAQREENFLTYQKSIQNNELTITIREGDFISNFAYPVVSKDRNEIVQSLIENEVEVRPLIAGSIGLSPFWIKRYGITNLDNCNLINDYGFYIPNHHGLTSEDIKFVSDVINKV